ncbi:MAG: leucine-rich repeat domain-containing protein [Candidatus Diapherotrites archaeon]
MNAKVLLFVFLVAAILLSGCPNGGDNGGNGGTTPPSGGSTPPSGGTTPPSGGTTPPTGGGGPPGAPQDAPTAHIGTTTDWSSDIGFLIPLEGTSKAIYIRGDVSGKCRTGDAYCDELNDYMYCVNGGWMGYEEKRCTDEYLAKDGDVVCSNAEYTAIAENVKSSPSVRLDDASQAKLDAAVKAQGDAALDGISALTCLTSLNLNNLDLYSKTKIKDTSALSGLVNVRTLYIGGQDISDVSPLSALKRLKTLSLSVNPITDVSPLKNFQNLKTVNLDRIDADTSSAACEQLKSSLPNIEVSC